jgi:SpoVK/Ycf46/Vps4 family AAA+-type ATPase
MNKDFIKVGDRILLSRKGLDYDLKSGHVYNLMYERYEGFGYLEEDGKLTTPNRIYSSGIENELIDRVLTYFHDNNKSVGVLLEGLKGSGKTLTCKRIANRSELPIIVVDAMFPSVKLTEFFTKVTTDVVIIFDEVEKNRNWNSEDLLSFLDGIQDTCKKIVLMTCNKSTDLSNYLKDRCSRIRYKMHFDGLSNELIKEVVNDKISDKSSQINSIIIYQTIFQ